MKELTETRNQHFIPRFLLRNFSWCINPKQKRKRQKFKTHYVEAKGKIIVRDISKIACSDYFYEEVIENELSIEKQLSQKENSIAKTLSIIKNECFIHKSQYTIISDFVLHLTWRTENNRSLMTAFMHRSFEGVAGEMVSNRSEMSKIKTNAFDNYFHENGVTLDRNQRAKLINYASPHMDAEINEGMENFLRNELPDFMASLSSKTQSNLAVRKFSDGHPILKNFIWELIESDMSLILGDGGPIAFEESIENWGPLFWMMNLNNVSHIVLPISSRTYLLGKYSNITDELSGLSISVLNEIQAKMSFKFFISEDNELADKYQNLIGQIQANYRNEWSVQTLKKNRSLLESSWSFLFHRKIFS